MPRILILHTPPVIQTCVRLGLPLSAQSRDWGALRAVLQEGAPGALAIVDPYHGTADGGLAAELEALITDFAYIPFVCAMRTRGQHRDVVQIARWGAAEILSLDEDNLPLALAQYLDLAKSRALRNTVRRLLPEGLSGRATSLMLRAADVAHDGGSVEDLSRSLRVSRRTASRWYQGSRLPTPKRLLVWLRLIRAAQILDETTRSVTTVAHACGYAYDANLRTALLRFVGRGPRALRRAGAVSVVATRFRAEIGSSGRVPPPL